MYLLVLNLLVTGLLASALPGTPTCSTGMPGKLRTVVTTDMEQDDLASLIRYLLYANELDNEGIIYSASKWHWAGDGKGTEFFLPDREYNTSQTSWRWTGTRTIQDKVLQAYAEVYPNLIRHDPSYPTPDELLSKVKIGNIDFEGEMDHDTDGSNLIRSLLLDDDPRPLYLQAWGGTNTIARALKSIEDQFSSSQQWPQLKNSISRQAVLLASGFQDNAYADYISLNWPQVRTEDLSAAYTTWGYNCRGTRGPPEDNVYFTGDWIGANIEIGPYGSLYRSYLDGQSMPGDPEDIFGDPAKVFVPGARCVPKEKYDFISEGDNVVFNPLLTTGLQDPSNPNLGGWGGRAQQNSTSPDLWVLVGSEKAPNGTEVKGYTASRWIAAVQNDFAARMRWTMTPEYDQANHAPSAKILNGATVAGRRGSTVELFGLVSDPDRDHVTTTWWQYVEEGSYPNAATVAAATGGEGCATVKIPEDAKPGQTISIILQATDDGQFPLTRYDRVFIHVV